MTGGPAPCGSQRYVVPLLLTDANTAAMVKALLLDVICYRLYARRMPIPEDAAIAYKAAIGRAEKIGAGTIGLVGEVQVGAAPAGAGTITVEATERILSRETMNGL